MAGIEGKHLVSSISNEISAKLLSFCTPTQAEELAAQFRISDVSGSGVIDENEFRALLQRMGIPISIAEADALVSSIDANADGLVDFAELVQMIMRLQRGDTTLGALKKFVEALDATPVALLEREVAKFGLQAVYKLIEEEEEIPATLNGELSTVFHMQLELVGKTCGPTGRKSVRATGKTTREAKFKAAETALVELKKLQPGLAVEPGELPEEWERWLFANIERGASATKLMHTLTQKGFLLTKNLVTMQRISTRISSFRLRTKRDAPSSIYSTGAHEVLSRRNNDVSCSGSPKKSSRTARSIAAVEKLLTSPVQVIHPKWAHWCQQELSRGIDGSVVLSELVSQGFEPDRSPLFTQRLLYVVKNRDDHYSNGAKSPRTAAWKPFSFSRVLEEGILREVELFVFGGHDVNTLQLDVSTKLMQAPLHIASKHGYLSIAKMLLQRGAHVDQLDSFHRTPLMVAASCGHSEVAALMLEQGADIFQVDNLKNSALHLAAFSGSSTIASQLLQVHDDSFRLFIANLPQRRGECYERLLHGAYEAVMNIKLRSLSRRQFHFSWLFEAVQWLHKDLFGNGGDNSRICKMPVPQKGFMDDLVSRYHKKLPKRDICCALEATSDSEEDEEGIDDAQARRRKEDDRADWLSEAAMSFFLDTCLRETYKHLSNLQGRTALHVACDENLVCTHERVIQYLAEKHGCSPFLLDHSGRTPLQLLLACRGRPGSPKGNLNHELDILKRRRERARLKEIKIEEERVVQRRKVWQIEIDRLAQDFNEPDTLNCMRKLIKENNGKAIACRSGWSIYEEPLSHNRLFENMRSGFVQRQVPAQIVEEDRIRLGWKEKIAANAHLVERHRLHPEWELYCVNGADVYFFFNRETEHCQWALPEGLSIREWRTKRIFRNTEQIDDEPDQASLVVHFTGTASAAIVDNAVKCRTLGQWHECLGFGGVTFYLHTLDQRIKVEKPDEVLVHESYRYAHTLVLNRSEKIETHDRGWHRYYEPQLAHTFYYNELSGDCVHDTLATQAFLQEIRRPKRHEKSALTTEELRRLREEKEWKSTLQRARRHDENAKTAEKLYAMATAQQKSEEEELDDVARFLRQLESSITSEHLAIEDEKENHEERAINNDFSAKRKSKSMNKKTKNMAYFVARFRREREVFIQARGNNLLTSVGPAQKDPRCEIDRSEEMEHELNEEEVKDAILEDVESEPAIIERRRVGRLLTRTEERLRLGRALCRWGCERWFSRELSLGEHERVECPRRLMVCRLGCTMVLERQQWRDVVYLHESENEEQCPSRIVYCPQDCGVWLPHFDLADPHLRRLCTRRPVEELQCRLGCGQPSRHHLARLAHEQDECELRKVKCTWPKCNAMVLAKEQNAHRRAHLLSSGISSFVTAEVHEYTVPRDVKLLKFQAWGAGGGSGLLRGQTVGHGGGGAFIQGICPVVPGETLFIAVGSGGSGGKFARLTEVLDDAGSDAEAGKKIARVPGGVLMTTQVSTAHGGLPGGGQGHSGNKISACGGGGGFTSIYRQGAHGAEYILIAAGGGGGGTCRNGGGGGACRARNPQEGNDIRCGRPGGDVAGGSAGLCDEFNPVCKFVGTNGESLQGGDGAEFGGGGGGGLFGGGGGGFSPGLAGGGGGGSSYVNANLFSVESVHVEEGGVIHAGGMAENPPQSVRGAYWDLVDGAVGEGGTGSMRVTAAGNHGGVRIARPGFFDDMKFLGGERQQID